jgi:soluble lytic murein transglycosylase-like protein
VSFHPSEPNSGSPGQGFASAESLSRMRKRLQLALMATPAIATLLSFTPCVQAATNAPITPTTDDGGHKVYVNDVVAPAPRQTFRSQQNRLVFWSTTERRWKSVPHANVQAAKSAAAEVDQYLGKSSSEQNSSSRSGFTQREVDSAIDKAAARHNVDPNLVRALVKVESNFNPNAVSRKGAMGLMQLMPQTARQLKVSNPFNPEENVDAGVRHLKQLLESYGGDVRLSLAAYNAGSGAVARSSGIPKYAETRNYVKRITQLYGGGLGNSYFGGASHEPVTVQRDARGVLYISNTD